MTISVARFYTRPHGGSIVTNPDPEPDPEPVTVRSVGNAPGIYDRKTRPADTVSNSGWSGKFIRGDYVKGFVIDVNHSELEPSGPEIVDGNPIDQAINQVSGTHADGSPYSLGLKVRLHMGRGTATWARSIGGGPITNYWDLQNGTLNTIPRFVHPQFIDFHVESRRRVAARYGHVPQILDFAFEGPMNIFAEWFILHTAKQSPTATVKCFDGVVRFKEDMAQENRDKLMAAGYSQADHLSAARRLIETCKDFDCSTSMALNPAQMLDASGNPVKSLPWTFDRASDLWQAITTRTCLGNNSMRADAAWPNGLSNEYRQQWEYIRDSKGSKYYQTANTALIDENGTNLYMACQKACDMGAWMIEVPGTAAQYTNTATWGMTPAQFDEINARCAANVSLYPAVSP